MKRNLSVLFSFILCAHLLAIPFNMLEAKDDAKTAKKSSKAKISKAKKETPAKAVEASDRIGKIAEVVVTGNKKVNSSIIMLSLTMKAGDELTESLIDENMKRVYNIGYFTQDIGVDVASVTNGKKVIIKVTENPVVQKIKLNGNNLVGNDKILKAMQTKEGQVFNHVLIGSDVKSIQKVFDEAGYVMNRIRDVQFDGETLTIFIEENRIEHIKIVGNDKTRERVILRELRFKEGEIYDDKKVTKSLQKIFNLGFFSEVKPRCEAGSEPGKIDFIIDVKEQKTGTVTIGGGYSSANGLVGIFEVAQKNWRGKGQTINAKFEFGGMRTYEFGFLEPWFRNKHLSIGANIYNSRLTQKFYQPNKSAVDYTEARNGFNVSLGKPFSEILEGSLTFRDENVKLTDADTIKTTLNNSYIREGHYQTLSGYLGRDTRDNNFNPRMGTFNAINIDTTGGAFKGPDSFTKYRLTLRKYHAISERDVIAGRIMGGTTNLTKGTLPLYEEYGVGGVYTVRGYEWREFIGKKMLVGNFEFRHKFTKNFESYLFYDMGDAWDSDSLNSIVAGSASNNYNLKKGYGLGVNFITPIGPIRLDYGKGQDRSGKAYFSMDRMF